MSHLKTVLKSLVGSQSAWGTRLQSRTLAADPLAGLMTLAERSAPEKFEDDSPIFILSAGWRSGSTLLQRLICSDQTTLIWGEPYDLCGIIQTLARLPRPVTQDWPPDEYFITEHGAGDLATNWIANLYPSLSDFRSALQAMLQRMFAQTVSEFGASRWGLKEVRFGLEEAVFLKWLFPNAKFLMIHRDVEDAFRSYQHFSSAMNWYASWPDRPVFTPYAFARHRQHLLNQFPEIRKQTGGLIISYEDLTRGTTDVSAIARYCGLEIDSEILKNRIQGRVKTKPLEGQRISWVNKALLRAGSEHERRKYRRLRNGEVEI